MDPDENSRPFARVCQNHGTPHFWVEIWDPATYKVLYYTPSIYTKAQADVLVTELNHVIDITSARAYKAFRIDEGYLV